MAKNQNFLIGYGERLTEPVHITFGGGPKAYPYTLEDAKEFLQPKLKNLVEALSGIPDSACPNDEAVAVMTLHPTFLAKSYFPLELLTSLELTAIGSRPALIHPRKWANKKIKSEKHITTEIYISGKRKTFKEWDAKLGQWNATTRGAKNLCQIENLRLFGAKEKILKFNSKDKIVKTEIVLHTGDVEGYVLEGFDKYLKQLDLKVNLKKRICVRGLCFLSTEMPTLKINEVAMYSYVRAMRQMPELRVFDPILRSISPEESFDVILPVEDVMDKSIKVAIFDGGLVGGAEINKWATEHVPPKTAAPAPGGQSHGSCVTSAFLFGPLERGQKMLPPYAAVDHYRVLDSSGTSNYDLPEVLERIMSILQSRRYDFINFSIGPNLPIEDNEVHMWTAVLDQYLSDGKTLAGIATGNDGKRDFALKLHRVQVPSDCVNGLAVGAANTVEKKWARAKYSSYGPGRHPGVVKPDILAFGGTLDEPFWVLDPQGRGKVLPVQGTSFASPLGLRMATGIRAHLGVNISPLGIKALLIHKADKDVKNRNEVGWGRIPNSVEDLITCGPNIAHVIYQGELTPGKWLRAPIPMPPPPLLGSITISATFCFVSETDPQDPLAYTRSGLEVVFRPNQARVRDEDQHHASSSPFFRPREFYKYASEEELRQDAHKWETTLHASKRFLSKTLNNPVFDIHYHARSAGGHAQSPSRIPYALVVSVAAPKMPDIYNQLLQKYRTKLEVLRPVIEIPIRTQGG
jgi:hypothetical protein